MITVNILSIIGLYLMYKRLKEKQEVINFDNADEIEVIVFFFCALVVVMTSIINCLIYFY
jgi:putative Mn2+ efflux pump MntP